MDRWPAVARLMRRLAALKDRAPALRGFSDRCLHGDPGGDSLHLVYVQDMTVAPARSFGPCGLLLEMRFDRGAARRRFPGLSVCDFGDEQISLMTVDGPPTAAFRALEDAIWGLVYEEAVRFEQQAPPG